MKKKLELPKTYKEISRAKAGRYWIVVMWSKKLSRAYACLYDGISEHPLEIYDLVH